MRLLVLTSVALLFSASAADGEPAKEAAPSTSAASKFKKNITLEFDGRSVDGSVVNPESADVEGDQNVKFDPLLEGRKDFKREFKRSSGAKQ